MKTHHAITNLLFDSSSYKRTTLGSLGSHFLSSLSISLLLSLEGSILVVFELASLLLRGLESYILEKTTSFHHSEPTPTFQLSTLSTGHY